MSDYNGLLEYLRTDSRNINNLLDALSKFTMSKGVILQTNHGRILSSEQSKQFEELKFTKTEEVCVYKLNDINCISIPYSGYQIYMYGKSEEYSTEIVKTIIPFTHLIEDSINGDNICGDMFLVNMSHEIRTPLNGVIGYAQLLEQTELNISQKNHVRSLMDCSVQLMQIINNILDVSRLNAGKMGTTIECFSMKEVEDYVRSILEQKIKQKKQSLVVRCASNVPEYIISDKQKVIQIIINLISNAHKYSGINTVITLIFSIDNVNTLNIQVIDEGIGIPDEQLKNLFKTFSRLHPDNLQDGSGLGLAISKKLAILLGGNLKASSNINIGSVFTVTIKFRTCEEVMEEINEDIIDMKDKKVIIVDNNVDNRILLSEQLNLWGMTPTVFASGKEAIQIIKNDKYSFDLGLIDICMPDIGGIDLAKMIKNERPLLPLIAISSVEIFENCIEFDHKIEKPINKVQLYDKIQRVLNTSQIPDMMCDTPKYISNSNCKPRKILIAEDVSYNRDVLSKMLNQIGYNMIDFAVNGQEAIDKMHYAIDENVPYDILLLDLGMPEVNGYDVIKYITKMEWKLPKIIVITASVIQGEQEKCRALGVNYFVSKPVNYKALKRVVIQASNPD